MIIIFEPFVLEKSKTSYFNLLELYNKRHLEKAFGTPLFISFLLTNECNLRCKHCFYHETIDNNFLDYGNQSQLTFDEYRKISNSLDWFLTGVFCGGEPFIREDFSEIISLFQKNNKLALADSATNGQLTDTIVKQVEKILIGAKQQTYSLGLSLEGFKDVNDEIRGKGAYDTALETWRQLKKLQKKYCNFEPYICTTMNTINESSIYDFISWSMKSLHPTKISLIKIRQNPRDGKYLKDIDSDNYHKSMQLLEYYTKAGLMGDINKYSTYLLQNCYKRIYDTLLTNEKQFFCYAGKHGGFVDYNGDIGVCEILSSIGNIREYNYDFKALWNSKNAFKMRTMVNNDFYCEQCTHESEGLLPSISFKPNLFES